MKISLSDIGKRFGREWIFRHFTQTFTPGETYAITGPNGSGKSTLLQIVGGALVPSEGQIDWASSERTVDTENAYRHLSLAAPYLEVIEEMTLEEFLNFHAGFKPWFSGLRTEEVMDSIGLTQAKAKQIRYFSSGMKQRVKLAQAIFSDTSTLLLDEPCTNLDKKGFELYHQLIAQYTEHRLVIVSSNDPAEYDFCKTVLSIGDYR
jgi:ABC-type multidrug transport system ATPase subunit